MTLSRWGNYSAAASPPPFMCKKRSLVTIRQRLQYVDQQQIDTNQSEWTKDDRPNIRRRLLRMWVSRNGWWSKMFGRTPLSPNLPASWYLEVEGRLRLHPLHFSWICTWPAPPKEQRGGAVGLGVARPNTKHLLCRGWGFVRPPRRLKFRPFSLLPSQLKESFTILATQCPPGN